MCLPSIFWRLKNCYRLILFLNFHIKYNQLYFCLSHFVSLPLKAKAKTPVFSIKTQVEQSLHSAELRVF